MTNSDTQKELTFSDEEGGLPVLDLNYPGRVDTSKAEWKKFENTIDTVCEAWRQRGSYLNIVLTPSTARKLANIESSYIFSKSEMFLLPETQRMILERLNGNTLRIDPFITVSEMDGETSEILGIVNHKFKSSAVEGPYIQVGPFSKKNGGLCPRVDLGIDDIQEIMLLPVNDIVDVDPN